MRAVTTIMAAVLVPAGAAMADAHALWPTDWNNWNDPALLRIVGDPGNAADSQGRGAVAYTYEIGTYEVTAGQYTMFLNAVAATDTYGLYNPSMWSNTYGCKIQQSGSSGSYTYTVAADWANRPVNMVSWGDAVRFANWLHNGQPTGSQDRGTTEYGAYHLDGATSNEALLAVNRGSGWKWAVTSDDEWCKAAYYKGGGTDAGYWNYPTRTNAVPSHAIVDPDGGDNANFYDSSDSTPYTVASPYYRTEAGEFENSAGPYGTFDQGGNVWEWTERSLYPLHRCLRGGSFWESSNYMFAGSLAGVNPARDGGDYGFRLVHIPEPATLSLPALSGLAILRRRRAA